MSQRRCESCWFFSRPYDPRQNVPEQYGYCQIQMAPVAKTSGCLLWKSRQTYGLQPQSDFMK
jgi:hypothetical protein